MSAPISTICPKIFLREISRKLEGRDDLKIQVKIEEEFFRILEKTVLTPQILQELLQNNNFILQIKYKAIEEYREKIDQSLKFLSLKVMKKIKKAWFVYLRQHHSYIPVTSITSMEDTLKQAEMGRLTLSVRWTPMSPEDMKVTDMPPPPPKFTKIPKSYVPTPITTLFPKLKASPTKYEPIAKKQKVIFKSSVTSLPYDTSEIDITRLPVTPGKNIHSTSSESKSSNPQLKKIPKMKFNF